MKIISLLILGLSIVVGGYLWFVPRGVHKPVGTKPLQQTATAIFAGGCFWCTESDFEKLPGVVEAISGYIGGRAQTATYSQTSTGNTQHREAVQVTYNPAKLSFKDLVDYHWHYFDPTDLDGQFADRGSQYTPAVFYTTPEEKLAAEKSLAELNASKVFETNIEVPIIPATTFYPAETYHQDYYLKNPVRYKYYRSGSGRDTFLKSVWGK